jgi:hypothetical protein
MDIIISTIAVIVAAGCFLAIVSSDIEDSLNRDTEQK